MIKLTHVKKYFNRKKTNEIRAINDTTITLPDSGLITFLGNSGCGKTTLLNVIGGLDNVDSGDIYIDDQRMTKRTSSARDELRNANIGYIFQNYNLIEDATVYANVALALRMTGFTGKEAIEERVMYILDRVGIARYRNRPVSMLSGGERQRVGIARAIVKNPRIVIADEPTGNLDSTNTIEIMNIIKAISRDKLVILVTHERQIAEFYADRIIEIVDGSIVSDRENEHVGSLDYQIDSRIYLKDMPHQSSLAESPLIELYTDAPEDIPPIKIIIRNGHIYVDTGDRLSPGQENVEILDEHYQGLSREIMDKYRFDYDEIYRGTNPKYNNPTNQKGVPAGAKYRTIYSPWMALKSGFRKIGAYSKLKKILLLGFVLASMFIIFAISNVIGVNTVTDDAFISGNKKYLKANVGILNNKQYERYLKDPSVDYVLPGGGNVSFTIPINDYAQNGWQSTDIQCSVTDNAGLTEEDLFMGRLPENKNEVVIDKLALDRDFISNAFAKEVGVNTYEEAIGRKLLHSPYTPKFTIVGISDTVQPVIFVDRELIRDLCIYDMGIDVSGMMSEPLSTRENEFAPYSALEGDTEKYLIYGELPVNDYEVLIPDYMMEIREIGETMDQRVNGNPLVVTGFYHDMRGGQGYYANDNTVFLSKLPAFDSLGISPKDKEEALRALDDGKIEIVDIYKSDREAYLFQIRENVIRIEIMGIIIIVVSLIEIYLILRASFLSRIKEVGVLRAVGLKKGDIYRMFSGEVLAITLLTALPGMAAMAYILYNISDVVSMYKMNIWIFLLSFAVVLFFNLVGGLLPVFSVLRKTPAEILSRNDVN